jgi:hypothetical protein
LRGSSRPCNISDFCKKLIFWKTDRVCTFIRTRIHICYYYTSARSKGDSGYFFEI